MITKRQLKHLFLTGCVSLFITLQAASAEETWRTDFDAACAQSSIAMTLSIPELKKLIEQCDRVRKSIEEQEETVRKVYLKRLQMCKNLYVFVLESKIQEQASK